jgi:IS5 family transposase
MRRITSFPSAFAKRAFMSPMSTIVDATIIAAPSSTKNAAQARDPEMKQTRKGNAWYFGMKLHVGTDLKGRVHGLTATHAGVADITQLPQLLQGEELVLYGDQAYWKEADRQALEARGVRYPRESARRGPPSAADRALARDQSGPVADPRPRRTPVPRDQAAVGVRQGALPRHRQEPGAGL